MSYPIPEDISYDKVKGIIATLGLNTDNQEGKYQEGYFYPLVEQFMINNVSDVIRKDIFDIERFVDSKINFVPTNISLVIKSVLNSKFSKAFLNDYKISDGAKLFLEIKKEFKDLKINKKITLLKHYLNNFAIINDINHFNNYTIIIEYYFPELKNIGKYLLLSQLSVKDIGVVAKCNSMTRTTELNTMSIDKLIRNIKELSEGEEIDKYFDNSEDTSETFLIDLKKVKCFNCGKFGHMKNTCRSKKKKKFFNKTETMLVEMPIADDDEISNGESDDEAMFNQDANKECYSIAATPKFTLDSGSTIHIINDESFLENKKLDNGKITTINGSTKSLLKGCANIGKLYLDNVKYIPGSPRNLISIPKLIDAGFTATIDTDTMKIFKDGQVVASAIRDGKFWTLTGNDFSEDIVLISEEIKEFHESNGHSSIKQMKNLNQGRFSNKEIQEAYEECEICQDKIANKAGKPLKREYKVGEYIHGDLIGPIKDCWVLIIADRASHFALHKVLKQKSQVSIETINIVKKFINILKLNGKMITHFRSDNEFSTKMLEAFFNDQGIIYEPCAPHSSFQNGASENLNMLIQRKAKQIMAGSDVNDSLWNFAIGHAVFLNNYLPRNENSLSPYEIIFKRTKKTGDLIKFGADVISYNYDRTGKFFVRTIKGKFLGYDKTDKIAFVKTPSGKIIRTSQFKEFKKNDPWFKLNAGQGDGFSTNSGGGGGGIASFDGASGDNETSKDKNESEPMDVDDKEYELSVQNDKIINENLQLKKKIKEFEKLQELNKETNTKIRNTANALFKENTKNQELVAQNIAERNRLITERSHILDENRKLALINKTIASRVRKRTRSDRRKEKQAAKEIENKSIQKTIEANPNNQLQLVPFSNEDVIELSDSDIDDYVPKKLSVQDISNDKSHGIKLIEPSSHQRFLIEGAPGSDSECNSEYEIVNNEVFLLVAKNKYKIPTTYKQALKSKQADKWKIAIEDELNQMKNLGVFEEVDVPKDKNLIKTRYVFNVKQENKSERFKARLVAKGFLQIPGEDFNDIFSPVVPFEVIRLCIGLAVRSNYEICQLDAKNAFLNADLDVPIYCEIPEGYGPKHESKCWLLKKALYGLKQSPRQWFATVASVLTEAGLENSIIEPCLFYDQNNLVIVYVDDILIMSKNNDELNKVKEVFNSKYQMKDMGFPKIFLGLTIKRGKDGIQLGAEDFINKLIADYSIVPQEKFISVPLSKTFKYDDPHAKDLDTAQYKKFRSAIGVLLYLANTVRYDICVYISKLSRYLVTPKTNHLKAAMRIIQYVCQTKDFIINYKSGSTTNILNIKPFYEYDKHKLVEKPDFSKLKNDMNITVVVDADWANDADRYSQAGLMVMVDNNLVNWKSSKQNTVALSSTEAEYMAITEGSKSGNYIKNLLNELKYSISYFKLASDNMSALSLANHKSKHNRSKHIDIKYHYIRNEISSLKIYPFYVNTKFNIADMLTKNLDGISFQTLICLVK